MSDLELSVIIPSVNSYRDLTGCLQALQAMTDVKTEIIVVDRRGSMCVSISGTNTLMLS